MTSAELIATLGPRLSNTKLIVVANREPYIHVKRRHAKRAGVAVLVRRAAGDHRAPRGFGRPAVWSPRSTRSCAPAAARGSRTAAAARDRETVGCRTAASGSRPTIRRYTLRRVWLTQGRRGGLLLRLRQQRAVAALPHRLRAARVRRRRLGAVSRVNAALRRRGARGNRRRPGDRLRAGLPLRAAAAVASRTRGPDVDRLPVLAHPVAEPRSVPHLPVERGDPRRPARQRPARLPHPATTATTSSTRSTATLEARVDYEHFARGSRRPRDATCGRSRSASTRSCGRGADKAGAGGRRRGRPRAALGLERASARSSASIAWTTRRASPSGSARSSGCSSAIPSGAGASCCCRSARRAASTCTRYQALSDEVDAVAVERSTSVRHDGWQPVIYLRAAPRRRRTSPRSIAPPTSAWCRRCTTA